MEKTSTDRRFEYSAVKENSRIAIEDFTKILHSALEQYQKLWDNYLDLLKNPKNLSSDFQENKKNRSCDNKNSCHRDSESAEKINTKPRSVLQDLSNAVLPGVNLLEQSDSSRDMEDILLSPVLNTNHGTKMKSSNSSDIDSSSGSLTNAENAVAINTTANSEQQLKTADSSIDDLDDSEINSSLLNNDYNCISVLSGKTAKSSSNRVKKSNIKLTPKKTSLLSMNKSHKTDVKTLSNGDGIKQTTSVSNQAEKTECIKAIKELNSSLPRPGVGQEHNASNNAIIPETPRKSITMFDDDIVQSSPYQTGELLRTKKKLQLKRKHSKLHDLSKVLNRCSGSRKLEESRKLEFPVKFQTPSKLSRTDALRKIEIKETVKEQQESKEEKMKNMNLSQGNSSLDETFFAPAEDFKENAANVSEYSETINKVSASKPIQSMPPPRPALLNKIDDIPWATKEIDDKTRKKSERKLMKGWSCWQCKKYYECLGLTEEELQFQKDLCSRHRSKYEQMPNTPASLWAIGFPDEPLSSDGD